MAMNRLHVSKGIGSNVIFAGSVALRDAAKNIFSH